MRATTANRPYPAYRVFFPAAALLAAVVVGVQVADYAGLTASWVMPNMPYWHGHEMIFGYALAVVGGFLFTRVTRREALGLLLVWVCGRLVVLVPGIPQIAIAVGATAFPLSLFLFGGLPFVKAAKSWDNAIFGPIVAGFLVAELVYQLGALDILEGGEARGLVIGIDVVALILFAMGGRIIAAATSGALQRKRKPLIGPSQPRWERAGVVCLFAMAVADFFMAVEPIAGALAAALAIITMVRLVKWRFWSVVRAPEVSVLHLGYAWLGVGFAVKASAQITGEPGLFDALHGVAVGALGTLSLAMMTRTTLQRSRMTIRIPKLPLICIIMVSIAAAVRLLAAFPETRLVALQFASAFWMLAFLLFAFWLISAREGINSRSPTRSAPN